MKVGTLSGLVTAKLAEHTDRRDAYDAVRDELDIAFASGKLSPAKMPIGQIFEELVDPNRRFSRRSDVQRIAEAVSTTAFPTITGSVIHNTIIPAYEKYIGDIATLAREIPATKTATETIAGFQSVEGFERRNESMAYEQTRLAEKYVTIKMADFGRIIDLTAEAIFDDRTGQLIDRAREVGKKGGQLRSRIITQTIEAKPRTAFGESAFGGFSLNGTALSKTEFYATTHATVADKQVNANIDTTILSQAGINALELLFQALVDEDGDEIGISPMTLLVPPALRQTANKLLLSNTDPETVSNDINPAKNAYTPMTGRFLSDTGNYFLGDFQEQLVWVWVWEPTTASQDSTSELAFTNQIISRYRFNWNGGCGHTDYRFIMRGGAVPA